MVVGIIAMLNDRAGSFIETLKKITKRERYDLLQIYDIPEAKHALIFFTLTTIQRQLNICNSLDVFLI